jgi:hypothetical protein
MRHKLQTCYRSPTRERGKSSFPPSNAAKSRAAAELSDSKSNSERLKHSARSSEALRSSCLHLRGISPSCLYPLHFARHRRTSPFLQLLFRSLSHCVAESLPIHKSSNVDTLPNNQHLCLNSPSLIFRLSEHFETAKTVWLSINNRTGIVELTAAIVAGGKSPSTIIFDSKSR